MILRRRRQRGHSAVRILPCLTTFLLLLNAFFLSESSNIHYTPHKLKDHTKRRRIQSLNGGKNSKGGRGTLKTQNEERRMKKSTKDFKSRVSQKSQWNFQRAFASFYIIAELIFSSLLFLNYSVFNSMTSTS